ncbi:MAG: immunoglobulin domain-containing protein, partial [Candidatus Kapabacteria bacterium]|nr:immunoglobulin domain-containing protein [Candidatus Kapabacteria bacterium]
WDAAFNVTITGSTTSDDIEALGTGTASARAGMEDGFLATLSPSDIMYSTLFGWTGSDIPQAIVRDARGDCFIAGATTSALPGQTSGGATDGFITKWAFGTLEMRTPLAGSLFCTGTPVSVSWITEDISPTSTYSLEYSTDNGVTWTPGPTGIKQKSTTWTVPNARPESGKVLLRISSINGHIAMGLSAYTVESAPIFVEQPRSATFCPGSMIELSPTVEGGAATYQWRKNGNAISGATQRVLSIASARTDDAGSYDVIATTLCKSVTSSAAVVSVSAQPSIRTQPQSANLLMGASVILRVQADGQALTYQWQQNDAPISGATSDTLLISNASTAQQGRYRCIVGSACGSTPSAEAVISVGSLAVDNEASTYQLYVSPQPASDFVRITTPFAISANARFQLHNVDGVNVALTSMINASSPTSYTISLGSLAQGVYTLVINDGSMLLKQTIVIKR